MDEVWRYVEDFDGYEVSNFGRIRSYRSRWGKLDCPKIMKCSLDSHGYKQVSISGGGKSKLCLLHRIIAKTFLSNPMNLEMVNHKDENPLNNRADNLEWCTRSYNNSYGHATDGIKREICCIFNGVAYCFDSIKEASIRLKLPMSSIFNSVRRGTPMKSKGLSFYYIKDMPIPE